MALPLEHTISYRHSPQGDAAPAVVPITDRARIEPANVNLPFLMLKLSDVQVVSGALYGERLLDLTDLVNGDRMSFKALRHRVPADLVNHAGQCGIVFGATENPASDAFIIEQKLDLIFMSDQGHCLHAHALQLRDQSAGSVMMLPAGFKATVTYDLIAQSYERADHSDPSAHRYEPQKMEENSG